MNERVELWDKPTAREIYLIAGWHQWADAGSISSGLPEYLIEHLKARKIGEIRSDSFYMFQIPATHHLFRPEIKFVDGFREELRPRQNDFYYTGNQERGLVIFLGEEPHVNEAEYAKAFFDIVEELDVKRGAAVGGVYGAMPYDKDREISCTYSKRQMKKELQQYSVRFSNYEGGATIGSYFVDRAERRDLEFLVFNAFVPAYDFAQQGAFSQAMSIENDFKAWYDLMRRFNHMFNLGIDLSDLDRQSSELISTMDVKINELTKEMPQLNVVEYLEAVAEDFTEHPFMPLDDVWERELGDLFKDFDDQK
ncbi:PAC2 family protein [Chloroflexi bacterium TSY]|nr:PAC2 family protein [Chloroflexi bacterium TSY]